MRRLFFGLVLCVGFCATALTGARSVERPRVDESQPAAPVCTFGADDKATEAMCGKCGDGFCNPSCGETPTTCPRDCGATTVTEAMCGRCGDGFCNPSCGETATTCPKDCSGTPS